MEQNGLQHSKQERSLFSVMARPSRDTQQRGTNSAWHRR